MRPKGPGVSAAGVLPVVWGWAVAPAEEGQDTGSPGVTPGSDGDELDWADAGADCPRMAAGAVAPGIRSPNSAATPQHLVSLHPHTRL